jgi:hypothetical protein
VQGHGDTLGDVATDLSRGRVTAASPVHLDPDLRKEALSRELGWRPTFGQTNAAKRTSPGTGPGGPFRFLRWFREVDRRGGRQQQVPGVPTGSDEFALPYP